MVMKIHRAEFVENLFSIAERDIPINEDNEVESLQIPQLDGRMRKAEEEPKNRKVNSVNPSASKRKAIDFDRIGNIPIDLLDKNSHQPKPEVFEEDDPAQFKNVFQQDSQPSSLIIKEDPEKRENTDFFDFDGVDLEEQQKILEQYKNQNAEYKPAKVEKRQNIQMYSQQHNEPKPADKIQVAMFDNQPKSRQLASFSAPFTPKPTIQKAKMPENFYQVNIQNFDFNFDNKNNLS